MEPETNGESNPLPSIPLTQLIPGLPPQYNYQAGIDAALEGKGYREIAQAMGMTQRQNLVKLRHAYPLMSDILARARSFGLDEFFDDLRFIVEDNPGMPSKDIRTKWEAGKHYLACSDPRKYGERMNLVIEERVDLKGSLDQARSRVLKQIVQASEQAETENRVNPEELRPKA